MERVPAGRRARRDEQRRSAAACSTAGSSRASPRWRAAFRIRLQLRRRRRRRSAIAAAYFGTADVVGPSNGGGNGLAPVYTCDPRLGGKDVGEKILDLNCISVPAFGENGDLVPPYNIRHADAHRTTT